MQTNCVDAIGVLALETAFRLKKPIGHKHASEAALAGQVSAIHVAAREGDKHALLSNLVEHKRDFVIRSFQDRRAARSAASIHSVSEHAA